MNSSSALTKGSPSVRPQDDEILKLTFRTLTLRSKGLSEPYGNAIFRRRLKDDIHTVRWWEAALVKGIVNKEQCSQNPHFQTRKRWLRTRPCSCAHATRLALRDKIPCLCAKDPTSVHPTWAKLEAMARGLTTVSPFTQWISQGSVACHSSI